MCIEIGFTWICPELIHRLNTYEKLSKENEIDKTSKEQDVKYKSKESADLDIATADESH